MIISASRRTDIPAFYARWLVNRIRAGYCTVPHPFNRQLVFHVSLAPEDVDVIVFWTRNPRPLFPYLDELNDRGYRYYFQFTLLDYPPSIDSHSAVVKRRIQTLRALADRIGPQRVIWRYDPIVFSQVTTADFHRQTYARLANALRGYTHRSVISILTVYDKLTKRVKEMARRGAALLPFEGDEEWFGELVGDLVNTAQANEMQLYSCASELELAQYGVRPGKCVDDEYIGETFGLDVIHTKDPGQRKACGCVVSKDIGMYESCLFGCLYCYATGNFERARANYARHDPDSPSMLGWYEAPTPAEELQLPLL